MRQLATAFGPSGIFLDLPLSVKILFSWATGFGPQVSPDLSG